MHIVRLSYSRSHPGRIKIIYFLDFYSNSFQLNNSPVHSLRNDFSRKLATNEPAFDAELSYYHVAPK